MKEDPLIRATVSWAATDTPDTTRLPARPGIFIVDNESGDALAVTATANIRRLVTARLRSAGERGRAGIDTTHAGSIRYVTVGSPFERDWAYLRLASRHAPSTYRHVLDRWRPWFVHCDPEETFPRFAKTPDPLNRGRVFGPFRDKHVAYRFVEMLESAFDLCRYHHILVQAPNGTPCPYKEMGRCAAPCDGTTDLDSYHATIAEAIEFATAPRAGREAIDEAMRTAGQTLDFEHARTLKRRLEETRKVEQASFRHARPIETFAYATIMPGERADMARVFVCRADGITPWIDVAQHESREGRDRIASRIRIALLAPCTTPSPDAVALIGSYLTRSPKEAGGVFVAAEEIDGPTLGRAVRSVVKRDSEALESMPDEDMPGG